jgi:hypothetical protein
MKNITSWIFSLDNVSPDRERLYEATAAKEEAR